MYRAEHKDLGGAVNNDRIRGACSREKLAMGERESWLTVLGVTAAACAWFCQRDCADASGFLAA